MKPDIVERELEYQKKIADEKLYSIKPIDPKILLKYSVNKNWLSNEKEYLFNYLKEHAKRKDKLVICEFGCGDGYVSCQIASVINNVIIDGIDLSPDLISIANSNAIINDVKERVNFIVGDAEEDVLEENKYDIVLALSVIHHISIKEAIRQLTRITKKNGTIIILEPIAFSKSLQLIRNIIPIKKNASPDERQLSENEVQCLIGILENKNVKYFNLLGRFSRIIKNETIVNVLKYIDYIVMQRLKIFTKFAGRILIIGEKRG